MQSNMEVPATIGFSNERVKSAPINSATDTSGGLLLYTGTDRVIIGVALDQNYRVAGVTRLAQNDNKQYAFILTTDPNDRSKVVTVQSTSITGVYYYLDI